MTETVQIGARLLGPEYPCLIIAEVAQAHDGSLGMAHAYIDAAAQARADAIKFQTHIAAAESTLHEPFRIQFSRQDDTRYDYWHRTAFTFDQWRGLAEHARERGLIFLSSPFSEAAVDLLERLEIPAYKIASGEIGNKLLVDRVLATSKPVLLSTGLSDLSEIDAAVGWIRASKRGFAIFQCTTMYPCPPERVGLNQLAALRHRYSCPVGLSDHTGAIYAGLAAVALGANMLEVHVTLSREMFGPDIPASLTTGELRQLTAGVRQVERMLLHPVDKDVLAEEFMPIRELFSHSVVAARDLPAGVRLTRAHLAAKKPGNGIPASRLPELVGRALVRPVAADELLNAADFDPPLTSE